MANNTEQGLRERVKAWLTSYDTEGYSDESPELLEEKIDDVISFIHQRDAAIRIDELERLWHAKSKKQESLTLINHEQGEYIVDRVNELKRQAKGGK